MQEPNVQLGLKLARTEPGNTVQVTMVVRVGQTVIAPTRLPAAEGMTVILLLRAYVVRSQEDFNPIFERKMRERQQALG